jgi:hypothetical protein
MYNVRNRAFAALFATCGLIALSSAAQAATTKTTAQQVTAANKVLNTAIAKAQKAALTAATADTNVQTFQAKLVSDNANLNLIVKDKKALQTTASTALKAYAANKTLAVATAATAKAGISKALSSALTSNGVGTTTANTITLVSATGTGNTTYSFVIPAVDYAKVKDPLATTAINGLVNYWTGIVKTDVTAENGSASAVIASALATELKSKTATCNLYSATYVNTGTANAPAYTATCSL